MSNQLNTFSFGGKHPIRTTIVNGVPLANARDIADALGYAPNGSPCKNVPQKWRPVLKASESFYSGNPRTVFLTEEGVYYFLCRSDKPKAKAFQEWFAGEVLPTIRKTGSYTDTKGVLHKPALPLTPNPSSPNTATIDVTALSPIQRLTVNALVELLTAGQRAEA